MSNSNLSRRSLIASLATVVPAAAVVTIPLSGAGAQPAEKPAAAASVSVPAEPPAKPDPIFAAIKKYRRANKKHNAAIRATDDCQEMHRDADGRFLDHPEVRKLERRQERVADAETNALRQLCLTVPTTFAGVAAVLRFVEAKEDDFLNFYISDDDDADHCQQAFYSSLRKAIERFAASSDRPQEA
jgi:hypothetical protein